MDALTDGSQTFTVSPELDTERGLYLPHVKVIAHGVPREYRVSMDFLQSPDYGRIKHLGETLEGLLASDVAVERGETRKPIRHFAEALAWLMQQARRAPVCSAIRVWGDERGPAVETTMDPESRRMLQVTVEDAIAADQIFTTLMGDDVDPRRKFIESNACRCPIWISRKTEGATGRAPGCLALKPAGLNREIFQLGVVFQGRAATPGACHGRSRFASCRRVAVFHLGGLANACFLLAGGGFASRLLLPAGFFLQQVIHGNAEILGDLGNFRLGAFHRVETFLLELFLSLLDQFFQFRDRKIVEIDSHFRWSLIDRVGLVRETVVIIRKKRNYAFGVLAGSPG